MSKQNLICIGCPLGCDITVEMQEKEIINISGNNCKRGDSYARNEVTNPTRIVTSIIRVSNGKIPRVSVKTQQEIPKEMISQCMKEIKAVAIHAPVKIGNIIIDNIANTGVKLIATKNVEAV